MSAEEGAIESTEKEAMEVNRKMKKLSGRIGAVLTILAFSAGMVFGVFGFEQVAEFVGEKESSLASSLHLHLADVSEASTKIAAVDSHGNGLLSDLRVKP